MGQQVPHWVLLIHLFLSKTFQFNEDFRGPDGSVAEWLACWTQAQKAWVQIAAASPRRCWVTVLGELFTPIVPLFTKQPS